MSVTESVCVFVIVFVCGLFYMRVCVGKGECEMSASVLMRRVRVCMLSDKARLHNSQAGGPYVSPQSVQMRVENVCVVTAEVRSTDRT